MTSVVYRGEEGSKPHDEALLSGASYTNETPFVLVLGDSIKPFGPARPQAVMVHQKVLYN
jgi:hypothetical protein